ncbi:hypothetical protein HYC85_010779 [Camellia sinensis]|uniref:AAA-type ATPase N-terminal domain-containing protein n=1 Tax=Camellia sinensis TaxID=4442 RepID=A0A7J7HJT1_CAMSI|nr:hypothetical protein HYC85_010779 [Camellia sinensis]
MLSTTSVLSTYTTFAASSMLVQSVLNEVQAMTKQLIPQQLHDKILSKMGGLLGNFSSQMILVIDETNGLSFNEMFKVSEIYLRLKISPSVERLKVSKAPGEKDLCVSINQGEKIVDTFEGVQLTWQMICIETQKTSTDYEGGFETNMVERRSIELCFDKKYRKMVLSSYLPYVLERSKAMKEENKVVKLNSCYGAWDSINLNHPSTFDTLAMDPTLKKDVIDDLDRILIAAAIFRTDKLEDTTIVTVSCGDEKIIIFTTDHKDRLDPALLRPGRMDMHIHMSYCTPYGFKILASNYLGINNHSMFAEIEKLVTEVEVTPAEIAEELMKSDEADIALGGLIKFLHKKKTEHAKANAEEEKEVSEQAIESPGNKGAENKVRENKGKKQKMREFKNM